MWKSIGKCLAGRADPARSAHFTFFRRRLIFLFSSATQPHRHPADKWVRRAAGPYLDINMDDIGRKHLPHAGLPVNPTSAEGEIYFITICCVPRGTNQLATSETWQAIAETLAVREVHGDMTCRLALAMPDHLHGLFGFPGSTPMTKVIADLKS